jgi:hypothetical protein
MTPEHGRCLNGTQTRDLHIRLRTADDLDIRNTLDGDVDRLVLTTNVGTFAMRVLFVADGSKLPVTPAPLARIIPLVGHVEPFVSPSRVRVLRDEGLEFVRAGFLDVDVVTDVRLDGTIK